MGGGSEGCVGILRYVERSLPDCGRFSCAVTVRVGRDRGHAMQVLVSSSRRTKKGSRKNEGMAQDRQSTATQSRFLFPAVVGPKKAREKTRGWLRIGRAASKHSNSAWGIWTQAVVESSLEGRENMHIDSRLHSKTRLILAADRERAGGRGAPAANRAVDPDERSRVERCQRKHASRS